MPVPVACPFCRTAFAVDEVPPARRTPCPHCGESVPVDPEAAPPADAPSPVAGPPSPPSSNLVYISLGLTAAIVVGFALWWFLGPQPPPPPPTAPQVPPATLPPSALDGLEFIPKDSQAVAAVQPAALWQYAARTGQNPDALLADLGVPKGLLDQLRDAGVPPDRIHHLLLGVNADDLKLVLVLVLREPLANEPLFREKLKAKGRDPADVELAGLPLKMTRVDESAWPAEKRVRSREVTYAYLFALNEKDLGTAKNPTAGLSALPQGVRESVAKVSPAAFAWAATDAKDWANLPVLKLLPARVVPPDLVKKLDGVRAVAAGLSLEPELQLRVGERTNDSTVARQTADAMKARLAELTPTAATDGEWADVSAPLDPPGETLPKLKTALK